MASSQEYNARRRERYARLREIGFSRVEATALRSLPADALWSKWSQDRGNQMPDVIRLQAEYYNIKRNLAEYDSYGFRYMYDWLVNGVRRNRVSPERLEEISESQDRMHVSRRISRRPR